MNPHLTIHIVLSIITSIVLCLAGFVALILAIQERLVRTRPGSAFIRRLPPLISMEKLLFQIIIVGFVLLNFLLITSIYYFHQWLMDNRLLWQKMILVFLAWVIFAALLGGRYFWGWRGRKAIYGTLCGVLLLIVVYFGSRLIL